MKKLSLIFTVGLFILIVSMQSFAQTEFRDIAVVGHNRNFGSNVNLPAPNTIYSGFNGGNSTFTISTSVQPNSYLKNKLNGSHLNNCQADLGIPNVPTFVDWNWWGPTADLLLAGNGYFKVTCGATILRGTFGQSILHVAAGSSSASLTLFNTSLNYESSTNVINNQPGNYSYFEGTMSIAIVTAEPLIVDQAANTVGAFKGFSNITFGARKLP